RAPAHVARCTFDAGTRVRARQPAGAVVGRASHTGDTIADRSNSAAIVRTGTRRTSWRAFIVRPRPVLARLAHTILATLGAFFTHAATACCVAGRSAARAWLCRPRPIRAHLMGAARTTLGPVVALALSCHTLGQV